MRIWKKGIAVLLMLSLSISMAGCEKDKKEKKPEPKKVVKVDDGNTNASKSGDGQSDAPFVIAAGKFAGSFNPFTAEEESDRTVVALTQTELVQPDRAGKAVYHGIDGEYRTYKGEHYTYYGASDLEISYDEVTDETKYHITLRSDLVFSDREVLNADDVIFTLYALCDKSYHGNRFIIKDMPVRGLVNYLANSSKAEAFSEKKVSSYVKKNPERLKKWIEKYIIKKELETGFEACRKNFAAAGYETNIAYFVDKYRISNPDQEMEKEKLIKRATAYYRKKGYRLLAKNAHLRSDYFDARVKRQARIFMAEGKGKKVSSISGIVRVSDFELEIITDGYDRRMTSALEIPICPLHYYGDKEKYDFKKNRFGFKRGDISALCANRAMPMGAGAYRYVKLEDGVAYFTSNELYFLGCPKTAYVQVKEMSDILIETGQQIKQKQAEEQKGQEEPLEEASPVPTVNPSAELTELVEGTVDMIKGSFSGEKVQWLLGINSNGELSGKTVETRFVSNENYFYLGIHGENVSVAGKSFSDESRALRKAIGTVFAISREALSEENGEAVFIPNYPVSEESWLVSGMTEEEYETAYNEDAEGEYIYDAEEEADEKLLEVKEAVLGFLEKAGYTIEENKAVKAPEGAKSEYELLLPAGEKNMCYAAVKEAVLLLDELGISIRLVEVDGEEALERILKRGKQELWLSMRSGQEAELFERYGDFGKGNIFGFTDTGFEEKLEKLQGYLHISERGELYRECFRKISDEAVEVPLCEFRSAVLFSSARMVRKTVPKELSFFYSPLREIQKIEMK